MMVVRRRSTPASARKVDDDLFVKEVRSASVRCKRMNARVLLLYAC